MIIAINYANKKYRVTQRFNSVTAIKEGKVDKVISYSPKDIDKEFAIRNAHILKQKRGNGYWLWKPYIILKTLEQIKDGDYLIYLDSGGFYINNVSHLIKQMDSDNQEIMAFELPFKERLYTKRDVFVCMGCDEEKYAESNQRMATMIIFRKNSKSVNFVREWLKYAQSENIITDSPNHLGKGNYKGFRDNRHDQSIFSLLSKKYNIPAYREPSQYGRFPNLMWGKLLENTEYTNTYEVSNYPQIIAEHKKSEMNKTIYREQMLFAHAPKIIVELYLKYFKEYTSKDKSNNKIAVLTDNMPIKETEYGYGMYKVVNRLLLSLSNNIEAIICTDKIYDREKVDEKFLNRLYVANKFHSINDGFTSNLVFMFQITPVIMRLKKKKVNKVFIPLGADYHELQRAYLISTVFHMNVSVYVVDDSLEYEDKIVKGNENNMMHKNIVKYMKSSCHIFAISKGMQERIFSLTGKKAILLPLPYHYTKLECKDNNKMQIMYVGGINGLYADGLRDIADIIDSINQELDMDIKLRFTYKNPNDVKHIIGSHSCIVSKRIAGEDELRMEMHNSLFCFMPYSENKELDIMQNTSFPSKLVEYLASAKSIVIYGNAENSAQRYFDDDDLPCVIHGRNKEELRRIILNHVQNNIDYSDKYVKNLKLKHSYKHIQEVVMDKV